METVYTLNDSIKEIMQERNLSLNAFAKEIDCDEAAVSRWLKNAYFPEPKSLIKIAKKYNISVDYLFGLSNRKEPAYVENDSSFYERYVKLKAALNITDYRVHVQTGISESVISRWKVIKGLPETDKLLKLKAFFNCSLDYLLGIREN